MSLERIRVIVHGGVDSAGASTVDEGLDRAANAGYEAIARGGDAVAGVEAAVRVLEADPFFNAGRGSVLNEDGCIETDAGIVDGRLGRFAGVAALSDTLHPVSVAAELLRRAPGPVLLAGEGAERFARSLGMLAEDLRTVEQIVVWNQTRHGDAAGRSPFTGRALEASDTVGAIAVDTAGRIAAASSTGGMLLKMHGRVGDAAMFGAGIYSDERYAALCSGLGEVAIQLCLAMRAVLSAARGKTPEVAVSSCVNLLREKNAVGGVLLYDVATDEVAMAHNARHFPVVMRDASRSRSVRAAALSGGQGDVRG